MIIHLRIAIEFQGKYHWAESRDNSRTAYGCILLRGYWPSKPSETQRTLRSETHEYTLPAEICIPATV